MARNMVGWKFRCKQCSQVHLVPYTCVPVAQNKDINLKVPCRSNPNKYLNYSREDFVSWTGLWDTYQNNVVFPKGFSADD